MIRELIKSVLEAEGFEVVEAADGEEAIRMCKDRDIDLSIIDIFLPKKGGLQVMGELIKSDQSHKFIAISGGEASIPKPLSNSPKSLMSWRPLPSPSTPASSSRQSRPHSTWRNNFSKSLFGK